MKAESKEEKKAKKQEEKGTEKKSCIWSLIN